MEVGEALHRAIHEELRESVVELYETGDERAAVVDDVWHRCWRVRSLLHLVTAELGTALDDDAAVIDRAAHLLAPVRTAHVVIDALDRLDAQGTASIRATLAARAEALDTQLSPGYHTPEVAASLLADVDAHVDRWRLPAVPWTTVAEAVTRTYAEAQEHASDIGAAADTSWELRHQLEFLHALPPALGELCDVLDEVTALAALDEELGRSAPVAISALALAREAELHNRAVQLGAAVFERSPTDFVAAIAPPSARPARQPTRRPPAPD